MNAYGLYALCIIFQIKSLDKIVFAYTTDIEKYSALPTSQT